MKVGTHILAELYGVDPKKLEKVRIVKPLMRKIISEAKFKSAGEKFHQFKPKGVTGVIVLTESHFCIHTWPEKEMLAADIFTCGKEGNAKDGYKALCKYFKPKKKKMKLIKR